VITPAPLVPPRDIDDNRCGRLSAEQAAFVSKLKQSGLVIWMALPVVGLNVGGGLLTGAFSHGSNVLVALLFALAGVAVLAGTAVASVALWRRGGKLAHTNVTWVDGRVAWGPSPNPLPGLPPAGWLAVRADGAPLPAPQAYGPVLPPGPWRFYLHDDRVVAAESPYDAATFWSITQNPPISYARASGVTSPPPAPLPVGDPGALVAAVAGGMGFTREDLDFNRRGQLSPRQGMGRAFCVAGVLTLSWEMRSKIDVRYGWHVGGRRFEVPLAWVPLAPPGVAYRAYFEERSGRLLSLEPATVPADAR
jgi:hypothetical protein